MVEKNKKIEVNLPDNININIEDYIKTDLDDMDYDDAIREDKRTFCQYFFEKLKSEQNILSTFFLKRNFEAFTFKNNFALC